MKLAIVLISLFCSFVQAEKLCPELSSKSDAFSWSESDFNVNVAQKSLDALQKALSGNGEVGKCHLPNAMAIVQGTILKQQAITSMKTNAPGIILKYKIAGFCEFIINSKPCE